MYMIMKAEVFKDGVWQQIEDKIFQSAIQEDLLTDRVCDERNRILYEVLGAPKTCGFEHTPITSMGVYDEEKNNYIAYLDDLIKYNWNAPMSRIGFISEWQYQRLKSKGAPPVNKHQYIANLNDNTMVPNVISPFEMDMILADKTLRKASKYYVTHEYDADPLGTWCEFFCKTALPQLVKLVPEGGAMHDVRVVYSFVTP